MTDTVDMELLEREAPLALLAACAAQARRGGALLDLCAGGDPHTDREELFRTLLRQVSGPGTLNVVVVEDVH